MDGDMESGRQYGVTPPISTSLPTPEDLRLTEALISELRQEQ